MMRRKIIGKAQVSHLLFLLPLPLLLLLILSPGRRPTQGRVENPGHSSRDTLLTSAQLRAGGKVPVIPLLNTLTKEDRRYLGLASGLFNFREESFFSLQEIQTDYIILEFLNRYCVSCMAQAPILNNLYGKIAKDENLRGRIKMLAVGAGNNSKEVYRFQEEKKFLFPIIPDPEFAAYEAFGNPGGTPYLLVLRQSPQGVLLAKSYLGLIKNSDVLLDELKKFISLDLVSFQKLVQENPVPEADPTRFPYASWSEEDIRKQIQQAILEGEKPHGEREYRLSIQKKDGPEYAEYRDLYVIDSLSPPGPGPGPGKRRWFAKIYNRFPLCDVCHPIYFLLIFNESGVVTNFLPLHITKYDNVPLTATDTRKLKNKIVGRHLKQNYQFQPEYDSVSGATMSVSLIFDTLNKAKGLYQKLQEAGYASAL